MEVKNYNELIEIVSKKIDKLDTTEELKNKFKESFKEDLDLRIKNKHNPWSREITELAINRVVIRKNKHSWGGRHYEIRTHDSPYSYRSNAQTMAIDLTCGETCTSCLRGKTLREQQEKLERKQKRCNHKYDVKNVRKARNAYEFICINCGYNDWRKSIDFEDIAKELKKLNEELFNKILENKLQKLNEEKSWL